MAGMLAGVECARRRRFHQSGGGLDTPSTASHGGGTRRPSFCLYSGNHETNHSSIPSMRRILDQENQDERLGGVAREAKERLDERLKTQRKSATTRQKVDLGCGHGRSMGTKELQMEVFGLKKKGSKKFNWGKLSWKAMDQEECAVCLDQFKVGETLVHLPCAHRFHSRCLVPWLSNNAHCPCCRKEI
ncbi:RING/U-box superfamily protein [Tripterygium wilfordii]|uniref:RING/U-box superfamily protein n=1 Tax=Tripterygium wilfordii TaxID=458696 RepID=A0A7J7D6W9_TRIWF|nr:probable E3 ubiquitin-protein ligase RHY1A isoform X2 [Tripterygium wilfordii]KAF5742048.1 RING/U-box superfamily protein [Tripterygium wilfordii]